MHYQNDLVVDSDIVNSSFDQNKLYANPAMDGSLVTIKRSDVPEYLHSSELYLSFNVEENDDEISVPIDCCKRDFMFEDAAELENLFRTMRYWILKNIPNQVISLLLEDREKDSIFKKVLMKYHFEYPNVWALIKTIRKRDESRYCEYACIVGRVDFLHYFCNQGLVVSTFHLEVAVTCRQLACLKYVHAALLLESKTYQIPAQVLSHAAIGGCIECVQYLLQNNMTVDSAVCELAARFGNLTCLKCLIDHLLKRGGTVKATIWEVTVQSGIKAVPCLEYLLKTVPIDREASLLVLETCRAGNAHALRYLVHEGFPAYTDIIMLIAALHGSLECLMYIHDELHFDCWVPSTMAVAAGAGQLELVNQLHVKGCPWDDSAVKAALAGNRANCLGYLLSVNTAVHIDLMVGLFPRFRECNEVIQQAKLIQLRKRYQDWEKFKTKDDVIYPYTSYNLWKWLYKDP